MLLLIRNIVPFIKIYAFAEKRLLYIPKNFYISSYSSFFKKKNKSAEVFANQYFFVPCKNFHSEKTEVQSEYSCEESKMASIVPQTITLDPVKIPIDECKEIANIKIELKNLDDVFKVNTDLFIFFINTPDKDSGCIKLNSIPDNHYLHAILKSELKERCVGKLGASKVFCTLGENQEIVNMAFIGCGENMSASETDMKRILNGFVYMLFDYKVSNVSLIFEKSIDKGLFRYFMESFFLEYVTDERFKSTDKNSTLVFMERMTIHIDNASSYNEELQKSRIYFNATYYACQLIAAPSNYCNPVSLGNAAIELAQKFNLDYKVLHVKEIEALKMGAYLSVGKGSMYPPRFIHLTYRGQGDIKKKVALVGKGITFDSGGYNLKAAPGSMIDIMKYDMSGCAAVLGCAYCIGTLKPSNIEVHFISAVCENMVSSNAYRPGDIITASNGKTIEVGNTDAEGRLTLADALVYAEKLKVDYIIDIATLTGAMLYSLGTSYAGIFGNSEELIKKVLASGKLSYEPLWWMPIINEYKSSLSSKYADINNISTGNKASSIIASLFLREFVNNTSWAHLDIAGVSWNFKTRKPRGFGVRLLSEFLISLSK